MDGLNRERSRIRATTFRTAGSLFALWIGIGCGESGPDPKRYAHHVDRAQEALSRGQSGLATADIELRSAIAADPENIEANFLLGEVRVQREDFPGAIFYFEETLALEPDHPGAAAALAIVLRSRDAERAQELANKIMAVFQEFIQTDMQKQMKATEEFATKHLAMIVKKQLEVAEDELRNFQVLNQTIDLDIEAEMIIGNVGKLEIEKTQLIQIEDEEKLVILNYGFMSGLVPHFFRRHVL